VKTKRLHQGLFIVNRALAAAYLYPSSIICFPHSHRTHEREGAKNDLCKSHFLLLIIINDSFMKRRLWGKLVYQKTSREGIRIRERLERMMN
jgi:hypothetical protein